MPRCLDSNLPAAAPASHFGPRPGSLKKRGEAKSTGRPFPTTSSRVSLRPPADRIDIRGAGVFLS